MENDIEFENITNEVLSEDTNENNTTTNTVIEVVPDNTTIEQLEQIHNDLGIICSFIVFFVLVILLKYVYKFFNMFFVMR